MVKLHQSQAGFILITTLLLIGIIAGFVLSAMQDLHAFTKEFLDLDSQYSTMMHLENTARAIIVANKNTPCLRTQDNPNAILAELKRGGCTYQADKLTFTYLIEDLGLQPCLLTQIAPPLGAHMFRLTIALNNDFLQISWAERSKIEPCSNYALRIEPGIKSWRFLPKIVRHR